MTITIGEGRDDALCGRLRLSFERYADLPAVEGRDAVLTYRDLDRAARAFALALRADGVRCGDIVPLLMQRSPRLLVAQLALLRLGATYAPIDLASPTSRRQAMLDVLRPSFVITDGSDCSPGFEGARLLDANAVSMSSAVVDEPMPWVTPPAGVPAYVMFTSGTTGAPKGVMVPRDGIVRLVCDADFAEFSVGARWGFLSSPAFDASTLEVWGPLFNGGCCVVQQDLWPTIDDLAEFLLSRNISDTWLTAALFNAMVEDRVDAFARLRQLLTGGERVSPRHARAVLEAYPKLRLINGYGPTENTTFTLCHPITLADTESERGIPVGRPIRGTVVRVVGDAVQGETGELWAGGDGVALGYLHDDDLSRRKFVEKDGQRWYRTGDLVNRRADGVFEFAGRIDRQVKIQGHRIELEEVEATLLACPGVGDAAVLVRGDSAESRHLVACFTGVNGVGPDVQLVSEYMGERLPPAAAPRVLLPMARLPLNINGKLDRTALASLVEQQAGELQTTRDDVWRTDTERALADIWRKCLRAEHVHRESDFWALGGTSLLALQISSQVRRRLARDLTPIDVLRVPVLAEQARHVDASPAYHGGELTTIAGDEVVPLLQGQQAVLAASQLDPTGSAYLVHVALHAASMQDAGRVRGAFTTLAQHHPSLRMTVRGDNARATASLRETLGDGWWRDHAELACAPSELHWPGAVLEVINRSMDLSADGVMRVDCWPVVDGSSLIVWTIHHVAVDEASIDRCLEQLNSLLRGETLAPTYGSPLGFAAFEKAWSDTAAAHAWAHTLVDALEGRSLALTRAPDAGCERAIALDQALVDDLLRACDRWGMTPFSPLIVAYASAVQDVFGEAWRFVSTPFSRRVEPELIEPVGYLLDVRVVEAGARLGESMADALARVNAAVLALQRPSFLPLRTLAEVVAQRDVDVARRLNAFCFTWRLEPARSVPFGDSSARLLRVPQQAARYGLTLHAWMERGLLRCSIEAVHSAFLQGQVDALAAALRRRMSELCKIEALPPVAASATVAAVVEPAEIAPDVEDPLRLAWGRYLAAPPEGITGASDFLRSGGNSLAAMRMTAHLRRQHGLNIDTGAFLARPTFANLRALAQRPTTSSPGSCVLIGRTDAPHVLVLVPGKGGRALGLYKLGELVQARMGDDHAVAIMDLDAMLSRVPHPRPLWFLRERMTQLVKELGPARVTGFVGFSLGGLLALRLARDMPGTRKPPVWLLDSYAPRVMVKSLSRRIERRVSRLLAATPWRQRARPTVERAGSDEPAPSPSPQSEAIWDTIQAELAVESPDGPELEVHLVQAQQSLDDVGVLWRRSSNGFNCRRYAKWYLHRLDAMHLDLPRALAADAADLFATGLRRGMTGAPA
ncbi:MAG TPA: amino acid adenylation domain-containing protein [Albitalea sp.]|nr:amino acid adenylation domain-containing protein [Albitalea sp.]